MNTLTERHVQAIWYDAALRPKALTTDLGNEVRVVHPGEWNLEAGPDFKGAVLELGRERRRVVGDVEVHLSPSHWNLHHHGDDERYRNVVAHVTWRDGRAPASLPPGCVSIWLGRLMMKDPRFSPEQIDLTAYPYARLPSGVRPCEERIRHDPDVARQLLTEAGRHRIRQKARRLARRLSESVNGSRQVYYEEIMQALGYKRNAIPFRRVAERLPIDALPQDPSVARSAMLVAGGFEEWDRTGVRPNNSPERRLQSAADLFTSTPVMDYAESEDFSRPACQGMLSALCGEHCLGRGRAAAILANVIIPFAVAACETAALPDWLPPEDLSEPVRLTARRLFGRDHNPAAYYASNGLLIQGLLQIHRDYCQRIHPNCASCTIPDPLTGGGVNW